MLKRIAKGIVGGIIGGFAGIGVGFSVIIGLIRITGGKADFSVIPLWVAYVMIYVGLTTFFTAGLYLIVNSLIAIYKQIKKLFVPSTT